MRAADVTGAGEAIVGGTAVGEATTVGEAALVGGWAVGEAAIVGGTAVGEAATVAGAAVGEPTGCVTVVPEPPSAGIGEVFKLAYWFGAYLVDPIPSAQASVAACEL